MPTSAESPTLLNRSKQVCVSIRSTVEPYALKVLDTVTNHTATSPPNPQATAMKTPVSQTRRMACTHLTMTRYYGDLRCPICRRDPDLGYTYLCSQDKSENPWSALDGGIEIDDITHKPAVDGTVSSPTLSPWIETGIANEQYTPKQIAILRAQKQKVNDTIAAALGQLNGDEQPDHAHRSTKSPSVDANSFLPSPVINEVNATPTAAQSNVETRVFPYCEFRACQTCRPTFRDRAWQKLNDVFADPQAPAIDFVNDNRPLSSPYIIAGINLREPATRPPLRTFESVSLHQPGLSAKRPLINAAARYRPENAGSNDTADQRMGSESKGFRGSLQRVFRGLLLPRRDSVSSKSSARSSRLMSRKMRVREEDSSEDRGEFDIRLWRELNDELLHVASSTKLPGHDGTDELEAQAQEVEVENGVAVMEESVDIGTADVIMAM